MSNYGILSLSAYYGIVLYSHIYAQLLLQDAQKRVPKKERLYDNSNPRSGVVRDTVARNLSAAEYGRWERARAAHANGLENFPLFVAATLAAHQAGLDPMVQNVLAGVGVLLRLAYTSMYINIENRKKSYYRSLVWAVGMFIQVGTLLRAGLLAAGLF